MTDSKDSALRPSQKLNLDRPKGRTSDAISIRFNASSLKDEDDLDLFSSSSLPKSTESVKFVMKDITPTSDDSITLPSPGHCRSSSAPVSEVNTPSQSDIAHPTTPLLSNSSVPSKLSERASETIVSTPLKGEHVAERSFISGIRERLQEPLHSIRDKIEVLKTESPFVEQIERRLRKTDSLESPVDPRLPSSGARALTSGRNQGRLSSRTRHGSLDLEGNSASEKSTRPDSLSNGLSDSNEDLNKKDGPRLVPKSTSSDSITKTPQALKPSRSKEGIGSSGIPESNTEWKPVSLSSLLSKSSSTEPIDEKSEFFDPDEDVNQELDANDESVEQPKPSSEMTFPSVKKTRFSLSLKQQLLAGLMAFIAYMVIPMPVYISGVITGMILASALIWLHHLWTKQSPAVSGPAYPDVESLPLKVPEMKESSNRDNNFKGWMNEMTKYNVESYHLGHTHSTYVTLEGSHLRLQTPRHNISRTAMHDDINQMPMFIHQRFFNLDHSKVFLLPHGLVRKRRWSKKYPICIVISQQRNASQASVNGVGTNESNNAIKSDDSNAIKLYLFGRTSREKEEWYRRFYAVSQGAKWPTRISDLILSIHDKFKSPPAPEVGKTANPVAPETPKQFRKSSDSGAERSLEANLQMYLSYMAYVMPRDEATPDQPKSFDWNIEGIRRKQCEPQILWVNALISRLFWDFLKEQYWCDKMQEKLQKKLSKIHVPYFINELTVTGIELGSEVPFIKRASKPFIDDRGLWIDLDILYQGGFCMILETKCNLMKLKKNPETPMKEMTPPSSSVRSAWTDSDEEDSAESSTDEEEDLNLELCSDEGRGTAMAPNAGGPHGRKFLRIVDRITQSKYFQQATEYKYIKRAMEGVSNTRLELKVELRRMCGTLAINIPHPPSDRLWYGFRSPPHFNLSAVPKVGEREFNVSQISDWIENKLTQEFQKVFVLPNMDDVPIPLMCDPQVKRP